MPLTATKQIIVSTVSGTSVGTSTGWIPTDLFETPFNVGFGVVKTGGGDVTFKVEHTFDNVQNSSVTPTAFTHDDVSAATGNIDGNYAFPCRAIRLTVVSASGSVGATLTVLQAGSPNG